MVRTAQAPDFAPADKENEEAETAEERARSGRGRDGLLRPARSGEFRCIGGRRTARRRGGLLSFRQRTLVVHLTDVLDGEEAAIFGQIHALRLFEREGACAASSEDCRLIAALINRAVAVKSFRDRQRRAFGLEGRNQSR